MRSMGIVKAMHPPPAPDDSRRPGTGVKPTQPTRLPRLPQHRHECNAAVGQRHRNHSLSMAAPIDIGGGSEELPADVPEMLDAGAPETHGYVPAAARTGIRRQRASLLIWPAGRDMVTGRIR